MSEPFQILPNSSPGHKWNLLDLLSRGSSLGSASRNRTCVCLNSGAVFDWFVGCYLYLGSHQCDSSVAVWRGGGDHENLAREPW